jgi:hypothetical protein
LESTHVGQNDVECAADDAVVLRGGDLSGVSREKNLRDVHEEYGLWGICATAQAGTDARQLANQIRAMHRMLMEGLTSELRGEGFDVVREPGHDWPDALIIFPKEPGPDDWSLLQSLMSARPQIPNPKRERRS